MDKLKVFLVADGVLIALGLVFFLLLFLRRKSDVGAFRDDLWERKKAEHKRGAGKGRNRESADDDIVDRQILLEQKPADAEDSPAQEGRTAGFRFPNFRGPPHEVLGVEEGASRERVIQAHKHWIKRYHPDRVTHLGARYVEQARRRSEQINSARDALLKRGKKP